MNNIKITIKKELRSVIRDKKSLLMMALTPLFIPILVILMSYMYETLTSDNKQTKYQVGVNYNVTNPTKINKIIASTYKTPANKAFTDQNFYNCVPCNG